MMNTSSAAAVEDTNMEYRVITMFGLLIFPVLEGFTSTATVFVAALNFCTIIPSSVFHPNLKFILLCQSSVIAFRAVYPPFDFHFPHSSKYFQIYRIVEDVRGISIGTLMLAHLEINTAVWD